MEKSGNYVKRIAMVLLAAAVFFTAAFAFMPEVYGETKDVKDQVFEIEGTKIPLDEDGFHPGNRLGPGQCWDFAEHVYYKIWNRFFYPDSKSEDDMLRDYPGGYARRINAGNAKLLISAAPVGSVIRLQSVFEGSDEEEGNRHSMILLEKNAAGCTVYHVWSGVTRIWTLTWDDFETEFRKKVDFGYFKYIKYPGAEPLNFVYEGETMEKELIVTAPEEETKASEKSRK